MSIEGIKDTIIINDTEYKLKCTYVLARKVPNSDIPGLQLELFVWLDLEKEKALLCLCL